MKNIQDEFNQQEVAIIDDVEYIRKAVVVGLLEKYVDHRSKQVVTEKEKKLLECLDGMMESDMKLYEKIMNTSGFAYHFNNLVNLANV